MQVDGAASFCMPPLQGISSIEGELDLQRSLRGMNYGNKPSPCTKGNSDDLNILSVVRRLMAMALSRLGHLRPALSRSLPALLRSPLEISVSRPGLWQKGCGQCGALPLSQSRHLATKKNKGALDHITVTTKDGKFPLNQLGQISMKSPQLILVNMTSFPEATAAASKAIRESGMNLNPEVDGTLVRVPIPKVTREHRENLAKLAKQFTNKAKESLRKVRTNAVNQAKRSKDTVSEDTIKLIEKQIQQMVDDVAADMDKQLTTKTKELLG
ncbi:ribosome-recycling factor, mitochondrial-like isoform X2 [Acipenser ruthenus]|uniref:ribosome-recycling factor, mitochondrial-like isoform X2 n=1 Tax=Acipenser ruthenus TaxID=7906 RepID=UPI002742136A|nr:ribosome-recycling factor, mitochondrial-like isoform X2 [Acipenser ruthenus]